MSAPAPALPSPAARPRAPLFGWLRDYPRGALPLDVLAGLTAAAVVLPKAMAYASVAGLPAQVGLCTAFIPPLVYAALGRSSVLSVTTTTTLAILVGSTLGEALPGADPGHLLAGLATLSVLVGLVLAAAAALRLGFVAAFISEPVLAGFKAGIGTVILVDQVPKLLGFHIHKQGLFRDVAAIAGQLGRTSLVTLAVSAAAVALLVLLRRVAPRLPAALVVVALGILASAALDLASLGVASVGAIPAGLPPPVRPDLALALDLWPAALAIALMSFTETIASGRAFSEGGERPGPNRELLATGAGNVLGGLFGAMPSGGGASQTLVARRAGARTPAAGAVVGLVALAALLFLGPVLSRLPEAVLAAIVVVYSVELLDVHELRAIRAIRRREFRWAIVACAGVLLLGTLRGILVAVITSLVSLAYQASNPAVYEVVRKPGTNAFRPRDPDHPDDTSYPGLLLVRVEGRVFFGNTERVLDRIAALVRAARPRVVVLDCSAIFDVEYSALKMLGQAEERLRAHGAELWLTALHPRVRRGVERSPLGRRLTRARMFFDLEQAVERFGAG